MYIPVMMPMIPSKMEAGAAIGANLDFFYMYPLSKKLFVFLAIQMVHRLTLYKIKYIC